MKSTVAIKRALCSGVALTGNVQPKLSVSVNISCINPLKICYKGGFFIFYKRNSNCYLSNLTDFLSIRGFNLKENFRTWLAGAIAVQSPLAAITIDIIDQAIFFIVNIENHIAHRPFTYDFPNISVLASFL